MHWREEARLLGCMSVLGFHSVRTAPIFKAPGWHVHRQFSPIQHVPTLTANEVLLLVSKSELRHFSSDIALHLSWQSSSAAVKRFLSLFGFMYLFLSLYHHTKRKSAVRRRQPTRPTKAQKESKSDPCQLLASICQCTSRVAMPTCGLPPRAQILTLGLHPNFCHAS